MIALLFPKDEADATPEELVEGSAHVETGIVDVTSYYGKFKIIFGIMGFAISGAMLWEMFGDAESMAYWEGQLGYYGYGYLWGDYWGWAESYRLCQTYVDAYPGCHPDVTPWEYLGLNLRNFPGRYFSHVLMLCLSILPLVLFFSVRRKPNIRFNAPLGAVYTWRPARLFGVIPGRMYIHAGSNFPYYNNRIRTWATGAWLLPQQAVVTLQNADKPDKSRNFDAGPQAARVEGQPDILMRQMSRLMATSADPMAGIRPSHIRPRWFQRSLLGPHHLPVDIDARAAQWLKHQTDRQVAL